MNREKDKAYSEKAKALRIPVEFGDRERTFDWTTRILALLRKYYEDTAGSTPKRGF